MDRKGAVPPTTPTVPSVTSPLQQNPSKNEIKQRRHSTPHISDGALINSHRLAVLAPKGERGSHSAAHHATVRLKNISRVDGIFKEKLPPRSRTGCWTCRTRKVKCDEEHPRCGQCVRLQHHCDYSPRLSFRDDTPRIIERMQEVSTEGSTVWDPQARNVRRTTLDLESNFTTDASSLPLFCELTNDDDRELKALTRLPGTYNLLLNPSSFSNDSDEMDEEPAKSPLSPVMPKIKKEGAGTGSEKSESVTDGTANIAMASSSETASDPDIVILRRFEDPITKRIPIQSPTSTSTQRKASTVSLSGTIPLLSNLEIVSPVSPRLPSPNTLLQNAVTPNDRRYLQYYMDVIAPQLFQFGGLGQADTEQQSMFEKESLEFPPLFHAMMALSALSLNMKDGNVTYVEPLQHYHLAIPELQPNPTESSSFTSDAHLYTHFFLLLYEIAAVELGRESLWQSQMAQLKRMLLERPMKKENTTTYFVIWFIILLDIFTALSTGGPAEIVEALTKHDRIPDLKFVFDRNAGSRNIGQFGSPSFKDIENEVFVHILSLYQSLIFCASNLARLCSEFRDVSIMSDLLYSENPLSQGQFDLSLRQSQVEQELQTLRELWTQHEQALEILDPSQQNSGSERVNTAFEQCEILFQTCVIFARTSLWAGQRQSMSDNAILEVNNAIQTILTLAQARCSEKSTNQNLGLFVFPLFLAGSISTSGSEKMWILELFGNLELSSIGRVSAVAKEALQVIYQRQNEEMMSIGHNIGVDWQSLLKEIGIQTVGLGF